jgi:hypothetical protein
LFHTDYDKRNDQMGQHLKTVSTLHLVTQHIGTVAGAAEAYHAKSYLDFNGLQSGHHNGNMHKAYDAAFNWSLSLWKMQPTKPVINTEAVYDGRGNNEGNNWREQDARKLGWIGWLSGALGYTYGAGARQDFESNDLADTAHDFCKKPGQSTGGGVPAGES